MDGAAQPLGDCLAPKTLCRLEQQALPRVFVHGCQHAESSPVEERVMNEIQRLDLIRTRGGSARLATDRTAVATLAPTPQTQAFVVIESIDELVVHVPSSSRRSARMICSSLNLLFRIGPSFGLVPSLSRAEPGLITRDVLDQLSGSGPSIGSRKIEC